MGPEYDQAGTEWLSWGMLRCEFLSYFKYIKDFLQLEKKPGFVKPGLREKLNPAASCFPTQSPTQYHRR